MHPANNWLWLKRTCRDGITTPISMSPYFSDSNLLSLEVNHISFLRSVDFSVMFWYKSLIVTVNFASWNKNMWGYCKKKKSIWLSKNDQNEKANTFFLLLTKKPLFLAWELCLFLLTSVRVCKNKAIFLSNTPLI